MKESVRKEISSSESIFWAPAPLPSSKSVGRVQPPQIWSRDWENIERVFNKTTQRAFVIGDTVDWDLTFVSRNLVVSRNKFRSCFNRGAKASCCTLLEVRSSLVVDLRTCNFFSLWNKMKRELTNREISVFFVHSVFLVPRVVLVLVARIDCSMNVY